MELGELKRKIVNLISKERGDLPYRGEGTAEPVSRSASPETIVEEDNRSLVDEIEGVMPAADDHPAPAAAEFVGGGGDFGGGGATVDIPEPETPSVEADAGIGAEPGSEAS